MLNECLSCMIFISSTARFSISFASVPSMAYLINFLGNKYSSSLKSLSIVNNPCLRALMDISTKEFISLSRLYVRGKYASLMSWNIFENLSKPKPIITAENVPPKTIINGEIRNSAPSEPPSIKYAPKIEKTPRSNPFIVPYFLVISNQAEIFVISLMIICMQAATGNLHFANS